ncbi:hypothetical protein ETI08_13405 [Macrococcoides goetzii]|nr:oligosaccharide flippase family protein [Macrococcus goetzii]TDM39893.1 hypothetical protein ETI08_13405 [Macrococcus goetzii]
MSKLKITFTLNIIQILTILISLFFQIYIFKVFTIKEVGILNALLSLINILSNIACFGLSNYIISKYSNDENSIYYEFNNIIKHILFSSLISYGVFLFIILFNRTENNGGILLFPFIITISMSAVLTSIFQVKKKYYTMSIFLMIVPCLKFILLSLAIIFNMNFKVFLICFMFFSLFTDLILILILFKSYKKEKFIKRSKYMNFLKDLIPYGILNFCFLLYSNISVVLLGFFNMHRYAAYLSVALLVINCILMVPTLIVQKLYTSEMYSYLDNNYEAAITLKNKLIKYVLIYGILVIFIYILIGPIALKILFDNNYKIINTSVCILLISLLFRLINLIHGNILSYIKFVRTRLISEVLVNLLMFISLILIIQNHNYYYILYTIVVIDIIWALLNISLEKYYLDLNRKR